MEPGYIKRSNPLQKTPNPSSIKKKRRKPQADDKLRNNKENNKEINKASILSQS